MKWHDGIGWPTLNVTNLQNVYIGDIQLRKLGATPRGHFCDTNIGVQLDWLRIAEWAHTNISLCLSNCKTKSSFGFLIKKSGALFSFFEKSQNEPV